jgi:hypothetical protein
LRERGQDLDISIPDGEQEILPRYMPKTGKMESYAVEDGVVREQKKKGDFNSITEGVGKYQHLPTGNEQASGESGAKKQHASLESVGLTDGRFAAALRSYVRNGRPPEGLTPEQRDLVRNAHWLMFVRESVRNPANLGHAAMTADLLSRNKKGRGMSSHEAFSIHEGVRTGGRGMFPMSMVGAVAAARGNKREDEEGHVFRSGTKAQKGRDELRYREEQLAERWVLSRTKGRGILGDSKEDAMQNGRALVKDFLIDFYGM